jgi:thiol-disulfide isomerase/thioredoxin
MNLTMMSSLRFFFRANLVAVIFGAAGLAAAAQSSPDGLWTGSAQVNGQAVPFALQISGSSDAVEGALVNGSHRSRSSSGSFSDGHLVLQFDEFANTIDATLSDATLSGTFGRAGHTVPFTAQRNVAPAAASANPPHIAGDWQISVEGPKGEHTWTLRVRQSGANVDAVIQRIDGDTGDLYGTWRDGQFVVSHFTAAGPSFAVLKPQPDGSLQVFTFTHSNGLQPLPAHRLTAKREAGVDTVADPLRHTTLANPAQPLAFRFPDLTGKIVASTDPEFRHNVVIVSTGGSWCPNCQDEAPFLESLYQRYHDRGLEIVEVSFEESAQLANPARLRAVIRKFGITYPVLVAGTPDQLDEKFPGVEGLNCWPTTFFVGRDGLVKAIHTGYSGPATGKENATLERETTALVQRLMNGDEHPDLAPPKSGTDLARRAPE